MIRDPNSLLSLSDAGAHLTFLCDAGFGLHFLGHWVRERGLMPFEEGVRQLTSYPAQVFGIRDRGRLVPGAWADLLLIDPGQRRTWAGAARARSPGRRVASEHRGRRRAWGLGERPEDRGRQRHRRAGASGGESHARVRCLDARRHWRAETVGDADRSPSRPASEHRGCGADERRKRSVVVANRAVCAMFSRERGRERVRAASMIALSGAHPGWGWSPCSPTHPQPPARSQACACSSSARSSRGRSARASSPSSARRSSRSRRPTAAIRCARGASCTTGTSLWWFVQSRNKKSVTVNLKTEAGQDIVRKLARGADIVVENFRPGAMENWGLGYDRLSADNPGLVMVRLSGYGQTGPYRDQPGLRRHRRGDGRHPLRHRLSRPPAGARRDQPGRLGCGAVRGDRRVDGGARTPAQRRPRPGGGRGACTRPCSA